MSNQTTPLPETFTDDELRMYRNGVTAKERADLVKAANDALSAEFTRIRSVTDHGNFWTTMIDMSLAVQAHKWELDRISSLRAADETPSKDLSGVPVARLRAAVDWLDSMEVTLIDPRTTVAILVSLL